MVFRSARQCCTRVVISRPAHGGRAVFSAQSACKKRFGERESMTALAGGAVVAAASRTRPAHCAHCAAPVINDGPPGGGRGVDKGCTATVQRRARPSAPFPAPPPEHGTPSSRRFPREYENVFSCTRRAHTATAHIGSPFRYWTPPNAAIIYLFLFSSIFIHNYTFMYTYIAIPSEKASDYNFSMCNSQS